MNILLINGGQKFGHSAGQLNRTLHDIALAHLATLGHQVKETQIEEGYDINEEIEKFIWADTIIYQMPGWWMMMPWKVKKYMDEVYTYGHGKLYENDGRTCHDPSKQYGSGGLLQGKQYMIAPPISNSFFRLGSVAASGTAPLPYNMTETASKIPPDTTNGIICETPVMRCWRVFFNICTSSFIVILLSAAWPVTELMLQP